MVESLANRFYFRSESLKVFLIGGINGNPKSRGNTPYTLKVLVFRLIAKSLSLVAKSLRLGVRVTRARISERSDVRPNAPNLQAPG